MSPALLLRLKTQWQGEYETWKQRRLDDLEVGYLWADGLYFNAGLEDTRAALLVLIGALSNGQKVVLAVESRQSESKESCRMKCEIFAHVLLADPLNRDNPAGGERSPRVTVLLCLLVPDPLYRQESYISARTIVYNSFSSVEPLSLRVIPDCEAAQRCPQLHRYIFPASIRTLSPQS